MLSGPLSDAFGRGAGVEALAVVSERIDDRVLDAFPGLRVVANYGAGYELIDVEACSRRGVAVTNTPGVLDSTTADLAFGLIIACRRRIVEGDRLVRSGEWGEGWSGSYLLGTEVTGATLGIVGLGRIGRGVAQRARGFEMRVLYTKRNRLDAADEATLGVEYRELDDLLAESEIVSLHPPLSDETVGLIDHRRLALMQPGACLVNTARGQIVDEPALVDALAEGRLQAGLDVFAEEPTVPPRLLEFPNVVVTPHIGSATGRARERMTRVLVDNLLAAEAGKPLPNRVN